MGWGSFSIKKIILQVLDPYKWLFSDILSLSLHKIIVTEDYLRLCLSTPLVNPGGKDSHQDQNCPNPDDGHSHLQVGTGEKCSQTTRRKCNGVCITIKRPRKYSIF